MNAFTQAAVLIHRYYLKQSILDCYPKVMMIVCLFLAYKSEEILYNGDIKQFCETIKEKDHKNIQDMVAKYETDLLNGINYEVEVLTPLPGV